MSKMRVYEYAKQNNLTSKAVIQSLKELNIEVSNHMSTISIDTKSKLDEKLNNKQNKETNQQPNKGNNKNKRKAQGELKPKNNKKQHKKQQKGKKGKNNKKNADQPPEVKATPKEIVYSGTLSVSDLAEKLNKD